MRSVPATPRRGSLLVFSLSPGAPRLQGCEGRSGVGKLGAFVSSERARETLRLPNEEAAVNLRALTVQRAMGCKEGRISNRKSETKHQNCN
ncbi:hypothetical protein chiPu_0016013 [Chiloscyllium punctatum]|uniref:Uncharacterized protein n=1 Tax=Chiloscyllium punctatum TaxID=137246 RepID=A0A401T4D8_CHIPU|nr:hypothetical protein [Chiloscyllium punctatum]